MQGRGRLVGLALGGLVGLTLGSGWKGAAGVWVMCVSLPEGAMPTGDNLWIPLIPLPWGKGWAHGQMDTWKGGAYPSPTACTPIPRTEQGTPKEEGQCQMHVS